MMQIIEEVLPISQMEWETVARKHAEDFGEQGRTSTSIRKRYQRVLKDVGPKGDPNFPSYVRLAKKCDRDIFKKAEMGMGDDEDESIIEMKAPI